VRYVRPFLEGLDAPDGGPSGCAHGGVFESSPPVGIGGAQSGGGGGVARGERADVPALDAALRGGGRVRASRPPPRQGVWPAGPGGPGGRSGAALPRALPGFYGQAFPRASGEGPWLRLGYTWTKLHLQWAGVVAKAPRKGAHRRKRERRPLPGMMLHQDGSRHEWLEGQPALDLIVTLDDATGAI